MDKLEPKRTQEFKLPSGVLSAAVASDEQSIVAGCMDGVYRVDRESGNHQRLYQHESYVSSVEWIASDQIVSAGYDGNVCWYDLTSQQVVRRVRLHQFWSWDMALSPDRKLLASVTGQYLAGGYKYEPLPEREPSIQIVAIDSGETLLSLSHVPSVQAVAISPDSQFAAAGNLMGEVRVYDLRSGELAATWTTPDFTSWGIIKSHSYLGGIFSMRFTPDGDSLLLAGMGPMHDPMAGNGRQLWQKWNWKAAQPERIDQTHEGESGEGLMEALAVDDSLPHFVMAGRLRGGDWNAAFFDLESGNRSATLKTGYRVTDARFVSGGKTLMLAGASGQGGPKDDGTFHPFGRIELYSV